MNSKVVSGIWLMLLLVGMLSLAFNVQPVEAIVHMDGYYWVDGDNLDIGFSKYGEMIGYDEATGVGVGLQYPGYETVGTHDQTEGTSRDPFANERIRVKYWLNGWLLEVRYTHRTHHDRYILAAAMFADMTDYGGDWITGKKLPFTTAPYGGRKTTAYAETEAIQVLGDDTHRFKALCTTHVYDWEDSNEDEVVDHPTETWPIVDVLITIIFNKAKKEVIVLKDVKLIIDTKTLDSPVDCQFSNRGEWDLGPDPDYSSYVHFYHNPSGDIAQVISSDLDYVGWAAFCPHLSDYTVDGWAWVFDPLIDVSQPDMIPAGSEPDIPFIVGEWDFTLDYVDPFAAQFSGVTIYGISDLTDGDDRDIGPGHENVVDSEVVIELPPLPDRPMASFTFEPIVPYVGDLVIFNASASYDPDGPIVGYTWDFGDGMSTTGMIVNHAYSIEGSFTITLTVTDNDGLTDTSTADITIIQRVLSIKLSGEHDYLFMERVKIRVAALVKDAETMEPVSGANVTIEIYDPEGSLWLSDDMTKRPSGTGIYQWGSAKTIRQLMSARQLRKGIYLVHVQASYRGGPIATDILEFHIDPPSEEPIQSHTILLFVMIGAVIVSVSAWYVDHRRLSRKLSEPRREKY